MTMKWMVRGGTNRVHFDCETLRAAHARAIEELANYPDKIVEVYALVEVHSTPIGSVQIEKVNQ